MKLHSVQGNTFKLDGGAMFGNAPKALWEQWLVADDRNRIGLATRGFLAVTSKSVVLMETGIGSYMEPKLRDRFSVSAHHVLLESLHLLGFAHTDITDVILSHLHFDHAGGLLSAWEDGREPALLFPNAQFYVSDEAWTRSVHPHARDAASFIPGLNRLLDESGRLTLVKQNDRLSVEELEIGFIRSEGHTPGLICCDLRWDGNRTVIASDLIPGRAWVHLPITMGYDRYPERLIDEKYGLLTSIAEEKAWLGYVHDPEMAVSRVSVDPATHRFTAVECRSSAGQ